MVWFGGVIVGWLVWRVQNKTRQKMRGNGALALSKRNLKGRHNNHLTVGVHGRRDV
jgi:hypothetical protein